MVDSAKDNNLFLKQQLVQLQQKIDQLNPIKTLESLQNESNIVKQRCDHYNMKINEIKRNNNDKQNKLDNEEKIELHQDNTIISLQHQLNELKQQINTFKKQIPNINHSNLTTKQIIKLLQFKSLINDKLNNDRRT